MNYLDKNCNYVRNIICVLRLLFFIFAAMATSVSDSSPPIGGTCSDTSSLLDRTTDYQYSHDETATIRLYPPSSTHSEDELSMNARVSLESTSTLESATPLFQQNNKINHGEVTNTGTPFSKQLLELISRYPLQRLLIRVGDSASSSSFEDSTFYGVEGQHSLQEERARGPSGTSIRASFLQHATQIYGDDNKKNTDDEIVNQKMKGDYQQKYASLLRYLLDTNLFPPCGAPLDSIRVRKHGHSIIVQSHRTPATILSENSTTQSAMQVIDVESFLAADAATFCTLGIHSLLLSKGENNAEEGWGSATNNGACHSSDNWGLFDSLFAPPTDGALPASSLSSANVLSELLLGTSEDSSPWDSRGGGGAKDKRHSVWIDLEVSPSCFSGVTIEEKCTVKVTRGVSYRIALHRSLIAHIDVDETNSMQQNNQEKEETFLHVALGDLLLGNSLFARSLNEEGWKAWYPCPLSDSSKIIMYIPRGYKSVMETDISSIADGSASSDDIDRKLEFNLLSWKDGYIDLAAPFAKMHRSNEKTNNDECSSGQPSSLYGISRTAQRPLGPSSAGTMLTVLRYGQLSSLPSHVTRVQSVDVLPGSLIKPRMHTLRMTLYQGNGAGGDRFSPPLNAGEDFCKDLSSISNGTAITSSYGATPQCARVHLSDLPDYKLALHADGSVLLERTLNLAPDSSLWMMVDYDEAYLPFQKFPADANRGVDAFPSRATFTPIETPSFSSSPLRGSPSTMLYSSSLLLLPPVPDMSMPFNVISLSCTVWAFVVGSLLNMLVRRGSESMKREFTGEKEKRPIDKLKEKIQDKKKRLQEKLGKLKEKFRGKEGNEPKENVAVE